MATQFVAVVHSAWTGTRGAGSVGVSNGDNWDMAERELEDRLSIPRYRTPYTPAEIAAAVVWFGNEFPDNNIEHVKIGTLMDLFYES